MARLADHGPRGGGWRLAARNIARNSRRAAASALALTIGLTVVAAVTVTATSLKESVSEAVSGGNRSDLILEPAGALGVAIAWAGLKGASALIPAQFQFLGLEAGLNGRVLAWSLGLAIASGLLVGLLPALPEFYTRFADAG